MKKLLLSAVIFFGILHHSNAQDTLRSQDMPAVGNVFVFSLSTSFDGIEAGATGENYDWDFSGLRRSSQRIDTILNPTATNPALSFFFIDNMLNSNRANQSYKGNDYNLGFTGLTDVFNYYYNTSAQYEQPGLGAVINSVPIPIFYIPHDVLYKFPLKFDDEDSVSYEYHVDLSSSIGFYYHVFRKRHNKVDGWGTLTTPYGTFDVVRINSTVVEEDSTFITSLNQGIRLPPVTTHEFKWMGKGFGLPLLQINTAANDTIITSIQYQDSIELTGISERLPIISETTIFPNPASEFLIVRYSLHEKSDVAFSLYSLEGKMIFNLTENDQSAGLNIKSIDLKNYSLPTGNYLIKLKAGNSVLTESLQISK